MNETAKQIILYTSLAIIGLYFLFLGMVKAQSFFVPIILAGLLSMILLPVEHKFSRWGVSRGFAILISDILLFGLILGIVFLAGSQIEDITDEWPSYQEKLQPKIEKIQQYIEEKTGISKEEQEEKIKNTLDQNDTGEKIATSYFPKLMTISGNFLLVFVYVFFFMYYRQKFKKAILNFIPVSKRDEAKKIILSLGKVSQQYLFGRFILILFLFIIYTVGFAISGLEHALLFALIAAILTLIPYLGNIIGFVLAVSFALITNSSLETIIGIALVFSITQFVESYILQPYIVGHKVEINPVVTIMAVIVGGMVWGIGGMIIAIPLTGILKVIFDHITVLQPLGYILDERDIGSEDNWIHNMMNRIASKFRRK